MEQPRPNDIDTLIERLIAAMKALEGQDDILNNPATLEYYSMLAIKQTELVFLRKTYEETFVPIMNKICAEKLVMLEHSKYKLGVDVKYEAYEELYEIIRMGYVSLYHKYEAFHKRIFALTDAMFRHRLSDERPLIQYLKDEFRLDAKKHRARLNMTVWEVNYIANSFKHEDGLPSMEKKVPPRFQHIDLKRAIRVEPNEFYADLLEIGRFMKWLAEYLFQVVQFRMADETVKSKDASSFDPEMIKAFELFRKGMQAKADVMRNGDD
jgi:hypothetical protein